MVLIVIGLALYLWRYGTFHEMESLNRSALQQFAAISWYSWTNPATPPVSPDIDVDAEYKHHWLDVSKSSYSGTSGVSGPYDEDLVEEMKGVYSVSVFFPFLIVHASVYACMGSLYYSQGCQMNYYLGSFQFPIAAVCVVEYISLFLLIPLMDHVVYPWLIRSGYRCTMLRKIGAGYFILAMAMMVAGLLEIWRKQTAKTSVTSKCDSEIYLSDLSIFWQLPQYSLCGLSQALAQPPNSAFFSGQPPDSMKTSTCAMSITTIGIGFLFGALMVVIVDLWSPEWITNDLDDGHLEYYFFLVTGIQIIAVIIFVPYAREYIYKAGTEDGDNDFDVSNGYLELETDGDHSD